MQPPEVSAAEAAPEPRVGIDAVQVVDALVRYTSRGTLFSIQFSNNVASGPTWSVHRMVRHLRETRGASVR